ncbi:MAG: DUF5655 domain-containing protein [Gemmatimonadota bacterium]
MPEAAGGQRGLYSVHPAVRYAQAVGKKMAARTGRSLEAWADFVRASGPSSDAARRAWLADEHDLHGTTLLMIIDYAAGRRTTIDPDAYLEAAPGFIDSLYSGEKEPLRPIHDRLIEMVIDLGHDIHICPRTMLVPIYRKHLIAEIRPYSHMRLKLNLALRDAAGRVSRRLSETGGAYRSRITHCFEIHSMRDVDDEVEDWLDVAYRIDV